MALITAAWRGRLLASATLLLGGLLAACEPMAAQAPQPQVNTQSVENPGVAIFAGGCFWCTESDFDKLPGVIETTSGYIGGHVDNPTYEQVSAGNSGHIEAVRVRFDPSKTSYAQLLEAFWPTIDPVTANAQFCDRGSQYRSAIFYSNPAEQQLAEASKDCPEISPDACRHRWSRKSSPPAPFTRPRTTTRTTTCVTRCATPTTATVVAATNAWSNSGARNKKCARIRWLSHQQS